MTGATPTSSSEPTMAEMMRMIQDMKKDFNGQRSDIQTLKSEVETLKSDKQNLEGKVQTLEEEKHHLQEKIRRLETANRQLGSDKTSWEAKARQLETELAANASSFDDEKKYQQANFINASVAFRNGGSGPPRDPEDGPLPPRRSFLRRHRKAVVCMVVGVILVGGGVALYFGSGGLPIVIGMAQKLQHLLPA
ncbi:hypothetical protein BDN72DRAFT_880293 [Pluteus cervinus]|uniref:Uncharacterized protein n=1 Tax=Pluteus cervinus TaxID=181527 RepID=A0ACD3AKL7_9AGAR|nr:hypothetical protein BDN72DRAFT_880293 [Pluteus cervinus]